MLRSGKARQEWQSSSGVAKLVFAVHSLGKDKLCHS